MTPSATSVTLDRVTWAVVLFCGALAPLSTEGTGWRVSGVLLAVLAMAGLVVSLIWPESFVATSLAPPLLLLVVLNSLGGERQDAIWWVVVAGASVALLLHVVGLAVIHRRRAQVPG